MIFVSIFSQDFLEYSCVGNVFQKNVPNNLECFEHLRKSDEISNFSRLSSI